MECMCRNATLKKIFSLLLFVSLVSNVFIDFRSVDAQLLPEEEVQALRTISRKLQIKHWNISQSSCRGGFGNVSSSGDRILSNVTCNCNDTECHVTNIRLTGQNLIGTLPAEFANLTHLQEIDLSFNYINGSIPTTFAKLPLTKLSASGNIISGSIPMEIGDIATLEELVLDDNLLEGSLHQNLGSLTRLRILSASRNSISGSIPMEIGDIATLEELVLDNNLLEGSLHQNLGSLTRLRILVLSANNFMGSIPETFGKLKSLTEFRINRNNLSGRILDMIGNWTNVTILDLSRNYISGSIPATFAKLPLTNLSALGNRISGSIPMEIGDIATLEELVLEENLLGGSLPQNLGSLTRLRRLVLSANNFTGSIPETFGKLKSLTEFRINGNNLSGRIPDMIGNWTNVTILEMQGTSMDGPIPSTISLLKNMEQLRISDLNGSDMKFPDLKGMTNLTYLVLRNCLITGPIPVYLGDMTGLILLDLSFNMLTGKIPDNLQSYNLEYMFLANNSLTGAVPSWILTTSTKNIDISYNNFTNATEYSCEESTVNLVSSYSSVESNSSKWCLKKDLPCPISPKYHSLFINCGGGPINAEGNDYEADFSRGGPSYFLPASQKWAYSSTGVFLNNWGASYLASNSFSLNLAGAEYYKTARLAPNSLKYYGLCLRKGSYTVRLHFAEIMFSDDQKFSSLGRRIFDVSIQGNTVLTDFNIAEQAKGVGKGITRDFNVLVDGSTLEIHLYWKGKGTTAIPHRGVYGPLISAITVTPNRTGLSVGAIVGIVAASIVFIVLILVVLRMKGCLGGKDLEDKELRGALELQTSYFTLRQIKAATNNFDTANKIGEGGFGPVYKGILLDGAVIAVKQLSSKSKQGNREFVNEIGMISALQHPNLVRLFGCCIEGNQLLLIYEYMENNSLARALFGCEEQRLNLDWPTRQKICLGIARGLAYLHEESRLKIVHRDIKATNVLLDKDLNAKISDFGLAKLDEEENTHISTRIAGTVGYMAPEYATRGYLTDKADVYSFGIVALEIVSGKSNTNYRPKEEFVYLLDWAYVLQEQGSLLELVDPILGSNYSKEEALKMLNIGLLCTNPSPTLRPSMSSVVTMLEGKSPIQAPLIKRASVNEEMRLKAFERLSQNSQTHVSSNTFSQDSRVQSISMDAQSIDSSVSIQAQNEVLDYSPSSKLLDHDHYDVNLN